MGLTELAAPITHSSTKASLAAPRRIVFIDALRGIAAITVAWFHLFTQNGSEPGSWIPHWFVVVSVWGRFGVQLFFILSGFVLTYTLLEKNLFPRIKDVGLYFLRRSVRLDPAYWFVLILFILLKPVLDLLVGGDYPYVRSVSGFWNFLQNWFYFIPNAGPKSMPIVWTLVLEVQFYLLFAASLFVLGFLQKSLPVRRSVLQVYVLGCLSVLAACWTLGIFSYRDNLCFPHLYCFMLGVSACMFFNRTKGWQLICLINVGGLVAGIISSGNSYYLASLVFFMAIILIVRFDFLKYALGQRFLVDVGLWSYTIYLAHMIVGALVIESLKFYFPDGPGFLLLYSVVGLASVVVVSRWVHLYIERPSIALSKKVVYGDRVKKFAALDFGNR